MSTKNNKPDKPKDQHSLKVQEKSKDINEDIETVTEKNTKETSIPGKKKPTPKVYKTLHSGVQKIPVWIKDSKGELVKKYPEFKNHTLIVFDPDIQKALDKRMEDQADLDTKEKDVMTEDEFYSVTSPERLYINYNGVNVHISDVRKGLAIAEDNGWKPEYREVIETGHTRSKVGRGDFGAGSVKL